MEQIRRILRPTDVPDTGRRLRASALPRLHCMRDSRGAQREQPSCCPCSTSQSAAPVACTRAGLPLLLHTEKRPVGALDCADEARPRSHNLTFGAGLLCDVLWADPDPNIRGWAESDRGVSFTFGADIVEKFTRKHDFDLIVRAHQARARSGPRAARATTRTAWGLSRNSCAPRPAGRPALYRAERARPGLYKAEPHAQGSTKPSQAPDALQRAERAAHAGGRGRLRVLCAAPARDGVLRAQLLRRIRQRGRDDVGGRDAHVLLPGPPRPALSL